MASIRPVWGYAAPVDHLEAHVGHLLDGLLDRAVLLYEVEYLDLRERDVCMHLLGVGHRHQRLGYAAADEGADTVLYHTGHAVDGTLDLGVREVVAGIYLLCLCLGQGSLGLRQAYCVPTAGRNPKRCSPCRAAPCCRPSAWPLPSGPLRS